MLNGPDGCHSGQCTHAIQHLLEVRETRREIHRLRRGLQPERQHAVGSEARIDVLKIPQRAQHQSRANAKNHRERHLRGDQRAKRASARRCFRALRLSQEWLQLRSRGNDDRHEGHQIDDEHRHGEHG